MTNNDIFLCIAHSHHHSFLQLQYLKNPKIDQWVLAVGPPAAVTTVAKASSIYAPFPGQAYTERQQTSVAVGGLKKTS
jgi:hypothetical protein